MADTLIKIYEALSLAPKQTTQKKWNNASPPLSVWDVQAFPLESSTPGMQISVGIEVTRVWRVLNRTPPQGKEPPYLHEHEIWYEVKNLSDQPVTVDMYAARIT